MLVLLLLVGASAGYFGGLMTGTGSRTTTSLVTSTVTQTSTVTTTVNESPCSQAPLTQSSHSSAFPNGTGSAKIDYPVFALAPGSTASLCVSYSNASNSTLSPYSISAFYWGNESKAPTRVSIAENPANQSIPPDANETVIYTLNASALSSGEYEFGVSPGCGDYGLLVSDNASTAGFSDFPGLLGSATQEPPGAYCISSVYSSLSSTLSGFEGMRMVYLQYETNFSLPFHETSRSVKSTVVSPTEQNITVTLGIQSYGLPVTVEFLTNPFKDDAYMARWASNPQEAATPGDPCDWTSPNNDYANDYNELDVPLSGVTVDAPTLNLKPVSNGTFRFSVVVSNLTQGYIGGDGNPSLGYVTGGYFAAVFSAYVVWGSETSPATYADLDLTSFFPVGAIGQAASGACPAPAESSFTNLPWYLAGLQPF